MDPEILTGTVNHIVALYEAGNLPATDFSVAELEGRIAYNQGADVSCRQVVGALSALRVRRKNSREWDLESLVDRAARRSENDSGGRGSPATP